MSAVLLTGLLLGFFVGVGATLTWAVCSTAACNQARLDNQLPAEVEAALHRLDHAAEQVRSLMRDVLGRSR